MVVWRLCTVVCLTAFSLSVSLVLADEAKPAKEVEETVKVELKDLVLNLPKSWPESDTVNSMRLATYEIPPVKGDKEKGELAISTFAGDGGGVVMNLERWVGQFSSEGREVTITKGMVGENAYHIANISGTYQKSVGPPILRKTEPAEGYRMLGVIFRSKARASIS